MKHFFKTIFLGILLFGLSPLIGFADDGGMPLVDGVGCRGLEACPAGFVCDQGSGKCLSKGSQAKPVSAGDGGTPLIPGVGCLDMTGCPTGFVCEQSSHKCVSKVSRWKPAWLNLHFPVKAPPQAPAAGTSRPATAVASPALTGGAGVEAKILTPPNQWPFATDCPASATCIVAIGAAENSTCALDSRERVWCWGDFDKNTFMAPVLVIGGDHIKQLAREGRCGVTDGGGVKCWSVKEPKGGLVAESVDGLDHVVRVAGGPDHSCAVLADGGARCWGFNSRGQLGNAQQFTASAAPVEVAGNYGMSDRQLQAERVAVGNDFSCSLVGADAASNTVQCWGDNTHGQSGHIFEDVDCYKSKVITYPVGVTNLFWGKDVYAGKDRACAMVEGDEGDYVVCWGQVPGITPDCTSNRFKNMSANGDFLKDVAVGESHLCALNRSGIVSCQGSNMHGQLGVGDTRRDKGYSYDDSTFYSSFTPLSKPSSVIDVAAGDQHTCAVLGDGRVQCWGYGMDGQLGNGSQADQWDPVDVQFPPAYLEDTRSRSPGLQ